MIAFIDMSTEGKGKPYMYFYAMWKVLKYIM